MQASLGKKGLSPISAFAIYQKNKTEIPTGKARKNKRSKGRSNSQDLLDKMPNNKQGITKKNNPKKQKLIANGLQHKIKSNGTDFVLQSIKTSTTTPKPPRNKGKKSSNKPVISAGESGTKPSDPDDPVSQSLDLFKWLIAPVSPDDFFDKFWEQKPIHIERKSPAYYAHILNSVNLDKMLREHNLQYSKNVDVVSYENGTKEIFNQEGRAIPSAVWDYYNNGCSIRVLNPQTYNHKVHLLIATLQEFFGTMVGTNVYLTPPGSQGFAPHYDDIEAFVVQLEGRKHWKLYAPQGADILALDSSPNLKHENIGEPFMELTLQAGDLLYFPRGVIHEGRTDPDSHSLHITVSVYQHTSYADLLEKIIPQALKRASQNDVEFRKGLPLNYLKSLGRVNEGKNSRAKSEIVKNVVKLMQELIDNYLDVDEGADQLGRKFMHDSMPPVLARPEAERSFKLDGSYLRNGEVVNQVNIDENVKVRLLRYHCIRLVSEPSENTTYKLYYNTENANFYHGEDEQFLELDPSLSPIISTLQNEFPNYVSISDLPLDDLPLKLQLIADLWEHGLLVTQQPLSQ